MTTMTTNELANEQLELGFNATQSRIYGRKREARVARGQWWFAKMRAAVANAIDWSAEGQPLPEQTWMPGANRQLKY
jgi:hypothetical protein